RPPRGSESRRPSLGVETLEGRDVPAVTVSTLASALALKIRLDSLQLGRDVVAIETAHPTAAKAQILSAGKALINDALSGSMSAVFNDQGKLGRDASAELKLTNLFHLSPTPLLKYTNIQQDMARVVVDDLDVLRLAAIVKAYQDKQAAA